jgi:hypothetical protein
MRFTVGWRRCSGRTRRRHQKIIKEVPQRSVDGYVCLAAGAPASDECKSVDGVASANRSPSIASAVFVFCCRAGATILMFKCFADSRSGKRPSSQQHPGGVVGSHRG